VLTEEIDHEKHEILENYSCISCISQLIISWIY